MRRRRAPYGYRLGSGVGFATGLLGGLTERCHHRFGNGATTVSGISATTVSGIRGGSVASLPPPFGHAVRRLLRPKDGERIGRARWSRRSGAEALVQVLNEGGRSASARGCGDHPPRATARWVSSVSCY